MRGPAHLVDLIPPRAANAGSHTSLANDTFHGHTPYQMHPQNRNCASACDGNANAKRQIRRKGS